MLTPPVAWERVFRRPVHTAGIYCRLSPSISRRFDPLELQLKPLLQKKRTFGS